jgi:hypothetical protein
MPEENESARDPIEDETAVPLPSREAMSVIDGGAKLLPFPEPVDPAASGAGSIPVPDDAV